MIVLSHFQARPLLEARQAGRAGVQVSPDLGLSMVAAALEAEGARFPGGEQVTWDDLARIEQQPNACFVLRGGAPEKIQRFSERLQRHYSLMPTAGAPTLLIAGFPMHRIQGTDPHADTLAKIRAAGPLRGRVLDTCTGLGYTAVEAARTASQVITLELDETTLSIARLNPWSRGLFGHDRIRPLVADAYEQVPAFPDACFSAVVHDPPTFSLAGELYSGEFYRQLFRVLRRGGKLFHYIGDLDSRSGSGVARGVARRLQAAGFVRLARQPQAFGVTAVRP